MTLPILLPIDRFLRRAMQPWLCVFLAGAFLAVPARSFAQTDDQAPKNKDAQIQQLEAEVASLKAELAKAASTAPAAPAATPAATVAAPVATAAAPATASAASANASADNLVKMSAFEVRTTQGQGYSAGNSASAMKTSESLMDIPAQVIVITSDMVHDIGYDDASDVLTYAGLVGYYRGPAVMSRGSRIGNPYIDDVPQATGIGVSDNTNIDTYQVIKGPEQVMYPVASLGGIVLETTKKPLPNVSQYIFDEKVQQWGRQTFTFDANTPAGHLGDVNVTTRVEGVSQTGEGAFRNVKDDRFGLFPSIEFDWKGTSVLAEYDYEKFKYLPGGTGILTPNGDIYTGAGRRIENTPPNDYDNYAQNDFRLSWTQRLSDDWQVKTQGTYFNVRRYGTAGFPTTINWNNNTMTYTRRLDNAWNANLTVQTDVSGKYNVGIIPMTTAFGFNDVDQVTYNRYLTTVPTVTIPIGSVAAIDSIVFPPPNTFPIPANPGSRIEQYVTNGYVTQKIDVIPHWITVVGGLTESKIETVTDTNLASGLPYTSTDANGHNLLHRVGVIGYLTKKLTAYVSEATTFSPGTGVNYANLPNAPVIGKDDEVGVKASLFDGRLSFSAALYNMKLTNQTILAAYPALNPEGANYYIPIGDTNSHGWDASATILPFPGMQLVATGYMGTVHDANGNPIPATVENSWSLFGRYDFDQGHPGGLLHGFAVGGGASKAGGKWFTMSGLVLPGGAPLPKNSSGNAIFKLHQDLLLNLFVDYRLNQRWDFRVNCENVLDKVFPLGAQGVGLVDPVDPRTFSFEVTLKL